MTGGAGGKGVWGKPGSELEGLDNAVDAHDPNYDSESMDDDVQLEPVPVQLTADEVKVRLVTACATVLAVTLRYSAWRHTMTRRDMSCCTTPHAMSRHSTA